VASVAGAGNHVAAAQRLLQSSTLGHCSNRANPAPMNLARCCSIVGGSRDFLRMLSDGGSLSTIGLRIRLHGGQVAVCPGRMTRGTSTPCNFSAAVDTDSPLILISWPVPVMTPAGWRPRTRCRGARRPQRVCNAGANRDHPNANLFRTTPGISTAFWFALISTVENAWISKLKAKTGRFLRLPCAYGGEANSPCLGITLI